MVIACQKCNTRFHLDDARVPRKGVRVRCSRCKHAFFVRPPGASNDDTLHGIAADALESPVSAPAPAIDAPAIDPPAAASPSPALGSAEGPAEEEESDWQFNDEPGTEAFDASALGDLGGDLSGAVDPMAQTLPPSALGESGPGPDSSRDSHRDSSRDLGIDPDSDAITQSPDDLFGDGVPELALPDAADAADAPDAADGSDGTEAGIAETAVLDSDSLELGASGPLDVPSRAPVAPSVAPVGEGLESDATEVEGLGALGSPEEWDLLGGDPAEPAAALDSPDLTPPPPASPAPAPREAAPAAAPAPPVKAPAPQPRESEPAVRPGSRPTRPATARAGRLEGVASAAGLLGVAALFCIGLVRATPVPVPAPSVLPSQVAVGGLEVADLGTRSLENALAGPILVVRGVARPAPDHRPGEWFGVVLVDGEGEALSDVEPAGPALSEGALRERDPRVLRDEQARAAALLARTRAREGIPFHAVFERVPPGAAGVAFERVAPEDAVPEAVAPFVGPPAPTGSRPGLPSSPE